MGLFDWVHKARKSRKELLGDMYTEDVVSNPQPPASVKDISAYTDQRLLQGLQYVDQTLRHKTRKVSPGAQHCLGFYESVLKAAIEKEHENNEERDKLLYTIRTFESDIYTKSFLRIDHASDTHNLMTRLAELRRYEFAARYGDYFAHLCKQVKKTARLEQTSHFEQITGWNRLWTDITEDFNREESKWVQYRLRNRSVTGEQVKTTLAVYEASVAMGLDFEDIKECIALYADRNSLVHTSIDNLLRMGHFADVKRILARDLQELPLVTPKHLAGQIPLIQQIIESIIDQYFTRDPNRLNDPFWWIPKPDAFQPKPPMQQEGQQTPAMSEAHLIAMRKAIKNRAAERYNTVHRASMVHIAAAVNSIPPPTGDLPPKVPSPKRRRPQDDSATGSPAKKAKLVDKQMTAWRQLVNLQLQVNRKLHEYQDRYQTIEAPIDPLLWFNPAEDEPDQPEDDKEAGPSLPGRR